MRGLFSTLKNSDWQGDGNAAARLNRHMREKASLISERNVLFPVSFPRKIMPSQEITRYDPDISP
jgi:hypothetical protein